MNVIIEVKEVEGWEYSTPIPLMKLGKETVIGRLQRQLVERGYKPIVATKDFDVMAASEKVALNTLPEHIGVVDGNSVYTSRELNRAVVTGRDDSFEIRTISDYWYFIRGTVNAGKLDDLQVG